jgi:hypothetical protein
MSLIIKYVLKLILDVNKMNDITKLHWDWIFETIIFNAKHSFIILAIQLIKQVNGLVFISTCKNLL